jgi:hypothetical protein
MKKAAEKTVIDSKNAINDVKVKAAANGKAIKAIAAAVNTEKTANAKASAN